MSERKTWRTSQGNIYDDENKIFVGFYATWAEAEQAVAEHNAWPRLVESLTAAVWQNHHDYHCQSHQDKACNCYLAQCRAALALAQQITTGKETS